MTKIPVPNRQLRRHEFVIHYGHLFPGEQHTLFSIEEKNNIFRNWWSAWIQVELPPTVRYLAAQLEVTPDIDPRTLKPNANAGIYHVNACVFWTKPVRFGQQYQTALSLPSREDGNLPCSVRVIGSPAGCIDYCTSSGKWSHKEFVSQHEHCPTGNRPFQGARRKDALMDIAINFVQEGYDLKRMWGENPRVVMHFGVLKMRDLIELQKQIDRDLFPPNRGDEPSVTGFAQGDTP